MMKIQLNKELLENARKHAEEFAALNIKGKEKHIFKTENNFEKKRIGFLGELAFAEYLKLENIEYETDNVLFRKDKFDFKILGKTFDVKTSLWMVYKKLGHLLINQQQADQKKYDYFVCVVIHMNNAEIFGFISNEDTLKLKVNTSLLSPAYVIEKKDLTNIKKLG